MYIQIWLGGKQKVFLLKCKSFYYHFLSWIENEFPFKHCNPLLEKEMLYVCVICIQLSPYFYRRCSLNTFEFDIPEASKFIVLHRLLFVGKIDYLQIFINLIMQNLHLENVSK